MPQFPAVQEPNPDSAGPDTDSPSPTAPGSGVLYQQDFAEEGAWHKSCPFREPHLPNAALWGCAVSSANSTKADATAQESSQKETWFLSQESLLERCWEAHSGPQ